MAHLKPKTGLSREKNKRNRFPQHRSRLLYQVHPVKKPQRNIYQMFPHVLSVLQKETRGLFYRYLRGGCRICSSEGRCCGVWVLLLGGGSLSLLERLIKTASDLVSLRLHETFLGLYCDRGCTVIAVLWAGCFQSGFQWNSQSVNPVIIQPWPCFNCWVKKTHFLTATLRFVIRWNSASSSITATSKNPSSGGDWFKDNKTETVALKQSNK